MKKKFKNIISWKASQPERSFNFLKSLKIIKNIINFEALIVGDGNLKKNTFLYR